MPKFGKIFFGEFLKMESKPSPVIPKRRKKFSGNFENENGSAIHRIKVKMLEKERERMKEEMNNLNIIANYLFDNPGARYSDITRHVCDERGKQWHRGHYIRYFSNPRYMMGREYAGRLWCKTPDDTGWMLTIEGYGYVRK